MNPRLSIRWLGITALTVFATVPLRAQDAHPDRFGLGVSGIAGSFGGYDAVLPGAEGFVRVARGSFWSARVDGAYYGGHGLGANVCVVSRGNSGFDDSRYIGKLGTLIEAGVGSEFRALGGNRIELRVHSASRSLLIGSSGEHPAVGASLTIGVVW